MENDLSSWLIKELEHRGWPQRELARRAEISVTTVSDVIAEKRQPTWEFCASIARPLGVEPDDLFVLAGLKRPPPAEVAEEREVLGILRRLPRSVREVVLSMLRGLAREGRARVSDSLAPYEWNEEPFVREIVEEVRQVPEEWREEALRQVHFVRQMSTRPGARFVGEASPEVEDEGERE